jgi:hypothetical protein
MRTRFHKVNYNLLLERVREAYSFIRFCDGAKSHNGGNYEYFYKRVKG